MSDSEDHLSELDNASLFSKPFLEPNITRSFMSGIPQGFPQFAQHAGEI